MTEVHLIVNEDQAEVVSKALDLYVRLGLGQFEQIEELAVDGILRPEFADDDNSHVFNPGFRQRLQNAVRGLKDIFGFKYAAGFGISHAKVPTAAKRAHEINCVLKQALAIHKDPEPSGYSPVREGLVLRYTQDDTPIVQIMSEPEPVFTP